MNNKVTFVIGGCRSGKSSFALDQANKIKGRKKYFLATSVPADTEMEKRVAQHQLERGEEWHTIEEPLNIQAVLDEFSPKADVILVDCLTLWVSNLMARSNDKNQIETEIEKLETALRRCRCPVFLVSNEVGTGIVPDNMLARQFRDFAGLVNQGAAKAADVVIMTIAGIDVQIKPKQ